MPDSYFTYTILYSYKIIDFRYMYVNFSFYTKYILCKYHNDRYARRYVSVVTRHRYGSHDMVNF